jgi:hypothetical protein
MVGIIIIGSIGNGIQRKTAPQGKEVVQKAASFIFRLTVVLFFLVFLCFTGLRDPL